METNDELNVREVAGIIADALPEGCAATLRIERGPGGAGCSLAILKSPGCVLEAVQDNGYYAGTVVSAEEVR